MLDSYVQGWTTNPKLRDSRLKLVFKPKPVPSNSLRQLILPPGESSPIGRDPDMLKIELEGPEFSEHNELIGFLDVAVAAGESNSQ